MAHEFACHLCSHSPEQISLLKEDSLRNFVHSLSPSASNLLKSNDPPCETRRKEVRAVLIQESERLVEIDAQMAQLQKTLATLFIERAQVQQRILDYKIILHPVRRATRDVLDEIFIWLVNENVEEEEEIVSYDLKAPIWALPHVSRQWRSTSLSFLRLWSTVRINLSSPASVGKRLRSAHSAFILGVQLQRSVCHPLSVSIYSQDYAFSSKDSILQILFPTSHRWKNLHLSELPLQSFTAIRPLITSFPMLKSLYLYLPKDPDHDSPIPTTPLWDMFQFCPNLQELHGHPSAIYPAIKLPFSQIRRLYCSFTYAHSYDCLKGLACFPNPSHLSLQPNDESEDSIGDTNHPEITLSYLSSIKAGRAKAGPIHLFKHLQAPSLRRLSVIGLDRVCDLVSFLQQSNSQTLTNLTLASKVLKAADYIEALEVAPFITRLKLNCPSYTDEFIDRLVGDDNRPRVVPSLSVLKITGNIALGDDQVTKLRAARPEVLISNLG